MSLWSLERFSPGLRKILGNTGWLLLDRVVRMGLGLVVGVWMARYLGPTKFGSLSFAISFVALFSAITTLGLENLVSRDILRNEAAAPEILGTAFTLRLVASVVAPAVAFGVILLLAPNDRLTVSLVGLLSLGLVFQAVDTIDSFFQSQVRSKLTVWAKNIAFLLTAGLRVWLICIQASLVWFAVAQVAELALGALGLLGAYQWSGGRVRLWRINRSLAADMLKQSWPVMLSGMAIMIYMRIDTLMLKFIKGDAAVGIYATATRLSEVWYFIPLAIVSSVSPAIIKAKDNQALYYERMLRLFSLMSLISLVLGSAIALSSHWIVHALYADAFDAAAPVLAVQIWASVFVFLGVAQGPWNISENLLTLFFYRTLAGALVNILLNLVFIPRWSAMGAAVATVISYAIAGVVANAFDARTRRIFWLQLRSLLPTALLSRKLDA